MTGDLTRLRTLTAQGDATAAEALHEHARRAALDADRRAAARALLASGRWRLEVACARIERHQHERALRVDGQPAVLAVARTILGWFSDHVLAWVATETVREAFTGAWQPEAVPDALRDVWHEAAAAYPVDVLDDDGVIARLRRALEAASARHTRVDLYCTALENQIGDLEHLVGEHPTELTACALDGDELAVAHIGTGGALIWRAGQPRALTRAHTLGHHLRDAGQLTATQLESFPHRDIVMRALGNSTSTPESNRVDYGTKVLRPGDTLVLATRELWRQIERHPLTALFEAHERHPTRLADALCDLVRERDPKREVTIVVARLVSIEPERSDGSADDVGA